MIAAATVAVCALRKEPANHSEMTSQLLFGELATVLETQHKFSKVRCLHDQYEGWCYTNQLIEVADTAAQLPVLRSADWCSTIHWNNSPMMIPFGSSLQLFTHGIANFSNIQATFEGNYWEPTKTTPNEATIIGLIEKYLGTAYAWGGRSVFGIDCSGFVQMVYQMLNISLNRDAWQQALHGDPIGFLEEVRCGDLAFFDNAEGKIIHVGILLNSHQIAHAAEKVRIDYIDNQGIIHSDTKLRTHTLRVIKRIIP
jgi:hypothetical protein